MASLRRSKRLKMKSNGILQVPAQCPSQHSHFLSLAAEIRNQIYELVLAHPEAILIPSKRLLHISIEYSEEDFPDDYKPRSMIPRKFRPRRCVHFEPPLLRICRSIRAEALPIFYNLDAFQAQRSADIALFLRALTPAKRAFLTQIRIVDPVVAAGAEFGYQMSELVERAAQVYRDCEGLGVARGVFVAPVLVKGEDRVRWDLLEKPEKYRAGVRKGHKQLWAVGSVRLNPDYKPRAVDTSSLN